MNKQEMQDALAQRAELLRVWLNESTERAIESLVVRKFPFSVVLHGERLSVADDGSLDIPIQLLIHQDYKMWSVSLIMTIRVTPEMGLEGELSTAGLLFQVVSEDGEWSPVVLLNVDTVSTGMDEMLSNNEWCYFWLQKFLKQPDIRMLFGYKSLVDEV